MRVEKVRIFKPDVRYRIELTPQEEYEFIVQANTLGIHDKIIGAMVRYLKDQEGVRAKDVNEEDVDV